MRPRLPLLLAAALAAGACKQTPAAKAPFANVVLPSADGARNVSLGSCPTERCLAIYVAPWCGYCRSSTPFFKQLRPFLRQQGMESWVVIGMDQPQALSAYAREFAGDALLDLSGAIDAKNVPHFYVVAKGGAVLKHTAGLPPDPNQLMGWILEK